MAPATELPVRIEMGDLVVKTVSLSSDELKNLVAHVQEMVVDPDNSLVTTHPVEIAHKSEEEPHA